MADGGRVEGAASNSSGHVRVRAERPACRRFASEPACADLEEGSDAPYEKNAQLETRRRAALALAAVACLSVALAGMMLRPAGSEIGSAAEMLGVRAVSTHAAGVARISYAGIVPYVVKRSRSHPRAVACGGDSSVSCVLSEAETGLHDAMSSKRQQGAGMQAVQEAARGRGFAPWHVSDQSKAARAAARRAVARSGHGHALDWIHSLWRGAENLDHEIDYGGRALPRVNDSPRTRGVRSSADRQPRRERVAVSAISKTVHCFLRPPVLLPCCCLCRPSVLGVYEFDFGRASVGPWRGV